MKGDICIDNQGSDHQQRGWLEGAVNENLLRNAGLDIGHLLYYCHRSITGICLLADPLGQSEIFSLHCRHNHYWFGQCRSQALWDPKQEECFMVAGRPRQIEVHHEDRNLVDSFCHENLISMCSINVTHPTKSVLVGGNSHGEATCVPEPIRLMEEAP